ncbi:MAG: hypothetical protein ACHP8B_10915 [Terriglobales bacterium]
MPHSTDGPPPSLWWYKRNPEYEGDDVPAASSQQVIDEYLRQCARGGGSVPEEHLRRWLQELSRPQKISPRRTRYWTLPAFALSHRLSKGTLMKRLRRLEEIAIQLFPDRVPSYRQRIPASEEQKEAIRKRFLEVEGDIPTVASEFGLKPYRVGQICRAEKALLAPGPEPTAESPEPSSDIEEQPPF